MEAYSVQGVPAMTADTEPGDPLLKSVVNGEEVAPSGDTDCDGCASLPEFVVEAPKFDKASVMALVLVRTNPASFIPLAMGLISFDVGMNIETTTNVIAIGLENLGVNPDFLRSPYIDNYTAPPRILPGFPGATKVKPKRGRARWKTPNGDILEWDSQHGDVEVYDRRGNHRGSAKPSDPSLYKPPVPGRTINP